MSAPAKYRDIAARIRGEVRQLHAGDRLPTEVELKSCYGVAQMTVRKALQVLLAEGLIAKSKGQGAVTYYVRLSGITPTDPWHVAPLNVKAEHLLLRALSDVRSGLDALPNLSAAEAALRIECGELPAGELVGYQCDCHDDDCPFDADRGA